MEIITLKKNIYLILILLMSSAVKAETLEQALIRTYDTNPKIVSSRKYVMSRDELVPQALSGWRPTIESELGIKYNDKEYSSDSTIGTEDLSREVKVSIVQPLYRGGATVSSTKSAENIVKASHELLISVENEILLSAIGSYIDVIKDEAILKLNKKNYEVLSKNHEAIESRFEVGELTKTDLSQSVASMSNSEANLVTAEGNLKTSNAKYRSIIGVYPKDLKIPEIGEVSWSDKEEFIDDVLRRNPTALAARYYSSSSENDINTVTAGLLPKVNLYGSFNKTFDPYETEDYTENGIIGANLVLPLYKSGSVRSKIRQAKHISNQKRIEVISVTRDVEALAIKAWEDYEIAKTNIVAKKNQIKANEIALYGVSEEESVGERAILDVLEAEENLLLSKVDLIKARREEIYKYYELTSKIGGLTADALNLNVNVWNAEDNYNKIKNKWWGTSVN